MCNQIGLSKSCHVNESAEVSEAPEAEFHKWNQKLFELRVDWGSSDLGKGRLEKVSDLPEFLE